MLSADGFRTSADFAEALLDESRVAVTPGEAFDAPGFVRISYATSMEMLREGSRRLLEFVAQRPAAPASRVPVANASRRSIRASLSRSQWRVILAHVEGRRRHRRVEQPQKFGNRAVRAFVQQGYTVIPINPHEAEVEGLKAYASVLDVPGTIDMASFYVPPEIGEQVIEEVAQKADSRKSG